MSKWPDLVVNILGVLFSGLLAFQIAKWQVTKQTRDEVVKEKKLLALRFDRMKIEVRDNRNRVQQLLSTLDNSNNSRMDLWEWAITIVNSFSTLDYDRFLSSGLQKYLPWDVERQLYNSYDEVIGLSHMVNQAAAAHKFYLGYSGDEQSSNQQLQNVRTYANTVLTGLKDTVILIYKHAETLTK